MKYKQLITPKEISEYRDIGLKLDKDKLDESIRNATIVDLYDSIGILLYKIMLEEDMGTYLDLLEGCFFTHCGEEVYHVGLKHILADLTYARYLYVKNVDLSSFGAHTKRYDDGQIVDRNTLKDLAGQARTDANIKMKNVELYIEEQFGEKIQDNPHIKTFTPRFWSL